MPTAPEAFSTRARALVLPAALLLLALCALIVRDSSLLVGQTFPGFLVWDNGVLVALHTESWTGAQAGLPLNGGRLVAIDGEPFESGRALIERARGLEPGASLRYRVISGETENLFDVPVMEMGWRD